MYPAQERVASRILQHPFILKGDRQGVCSPVAATKLFKFEKYVNPLIMKMYQQVLRLKERKRGFHLITDEITRVLPALSQVKTGLCQVFIQHTSASLTINENADPTVRRDLETYFTKAIPEQERYQHHTEGPDDMPAHIKAALLGSSVTIPVSGGRLALGTWQGIYLCEHRNQGGERSLIVTVWGE